MPELSSQPNADEAIRAWSGRFWLLTGITGIAAGLTGGLLMRLLRIVEHTAWSYQAGTFLEGVERASSQRHVLLLLLAGVFVGVGGFIIRKTLGKGTDAESAIWFRSGEMPFFPAISQALLAIVTVGMGVSLGRESPIKQAGGAIASRLAHFNRLTGAEKRVLVACGVGAGMAAAYNVPVGGALFAIEVLLGAISLRFVLPALLCSGVATATSWLLLPTGPIYNVPEFPLSAQLTGWAIAIGPLLGLVSVLIVRVIGWAETQRSHRWLNGIPLPVIVLTLLGLTSIFLPQLLGNGKDTVQLAFLDGFSVSLLVVLPILKLVATAACLGSGASGGLFTPCMAIGALLGSLAGHAWNQVWPGASIGSCSVIGSCAVLAATTQGPVSALVLVLELTRHVDATMVPMLLTVTGAMLTVQRFESHSIYSVRAERGTSPEESVIHSSISAR